MASDAAGEPTWDQLLKIGIDYVKTSRPALMFIGGIVALQAVSAIFAFVPVINFLMALAVVAGSIYLSMLLVRHALTGAFGGQPGDGERVLKLAGLSFAVVFGAMIVGMIAVFVLAGVLGQAGIMLAGLLVMAGVLLAVARFGFYLPATAVGHPTSLGDAFKQSEPYWGRIIAVMIIPALATMAIRWLLAMLLPGSFGFFLAAIVGGAIGAAGGAVTLAAIAYLYANNVRRLITAGS